MPDTVTLPLTTHTLANGMKILAREVHHAPVASFWVWYRVGSRNEVPGITGVSHWVEHMMFKGTPNFPRGDFDRLVQREGGVFNAFTSMDYTAYFATLPSDRLDLALRIEADRMSNSLFEAQEVESERTVIISELQGGENSPETLLYRELLACAFQAHSYHHMVIGWESDLRSMSRNDLYNHYRRYYVPNNAVAIAVGDFDTPSLLARLQELYGGIPAGDPVPPVRLVEPAQRGERRVQVQGPGQTAYIDIVYHAVSATHPDFFPLVIADAVLGGAKALGSGGTGRSSRLYKALVNTELAASASSYVSPTIDPFLFSMSATVRTGHRPEEVEQAMLAEVQKLRQEPVAVEELTKAIKQARAQFAYSSESVSNQAVWLGRAALVASTDWLDHFLERLAQVTAADVQRVAGEYLAPEKKTVGWYIPKG